MMTAAGTIGGVTETARTAEFSTLALATLANALRRFEARQAAEMLNRERTALALGIEPQAVKTPFEINQAVGAA